MDATLEICCAMSFAYANCAGSTEFSVSINFTSGVHAPTIKEFDPIEHSSNGRAVISILTWAGGGA